MHWALFHRLGVLPQMRYSANAGAPQHCWGILTKANTAYHFWGALGRPIIDDRTPKAMIIKAPCYYWDVLLPSSSIQGKTEVAWVGGNPGGQKIFTLHGWAPQHGTEGATLTSGRPHGQQYVPPYCGWAPTRGGRCRPQSAGHPHGGQGAAPRVGAHAWDRSGTRRRWVSTRASKVTAPAYWTKERHLFYPCSPQKNLEGRHFQKFSALSQDPGSAPV